MKASAAKVYLIVISIAVLLCKVFAPQAYPLTVVCFMILTFPVFGIAGFIYHHIISLHIAAAYPDFYEKNKSLSYFVRSAALDQMTDSQILTDDHLQRLVGYYHLAQNLAGISMALIIAFCLMIFIN